MISTVSLGHRCGYCGDYIEPGWPIAVLAKGTQIRCATCADNLGFPINFAEVDLERARLEIEARRSQQKTEAYRRETRRDAPAAEPSRMRPIEQIEMGFDYAKAAANDRDEVNS